MLSTILLLLSLPCLLSATPPFTRKHIPGLASPGPSHTSFTSTASAFSSVRFNAFNASAFQWYYFSALSPDASKYLVVVFFMAANTAFPLTDIEDEDQVLSVSIGAFGPGFADGAVLPATDATVEWGGQLGNGVIATYALNGAGEGAYARFTATPDLSSFTVSVNDPAANTSGTLLLRSTAPAHYPCGADIGAGQPEAVFGEHFGWTNSLPGAVADARFSFGGHDFKMANGLGYADGNWGDVPFLSLVKTWYWGRTTLGPYTVVFADGVLPEGGAERVAGYVAKNGKVLLTACQGATDKVAVRPQGAGVLYPPTPGNSTFDYLNVRMDLGEEGVLAFNITADQVVSATQGFYTRWLGHAVGGIVGGKQLKSVVEFELFTVS